MLRNRLNDDEFNEILNKAHEFSFKAVTDMDLPNETPLPVSVETMGYRIYKVYNDNYRRLLELFDVCEIPKLVADTFKYFWRSAHFFAEATRLEFSALGHEKLDKHQQRLTQANTYSWNNGWANTIYHGIFHFEKAAGYTITPELMERILLPISLFWLAEADKQEDPIGKIEFIAEAYNVIGIINGEIIWKAGVDSNDFIKRVATKGGKARGQIYKPLKEYVRELVNQRPYWPSRRNAAITVKDFVIERSKELNINLSKDQAQISIDDWLKEMGWKKGMHGLPANMESDEAGI